MTASSKTCYCVRVFSISIGRKAAIVTRGFCVCAYICVYAWVNVSDQPRGLIVSYSFPIKKVESASPSLWRFPTTPSWRIMTKPSNSCWKRSTRGQSSSSPVRKTYGEEHSTFWFQPCCSSALMACHVEVFNLWVAAPEDKLEAQIYHVYYINIPPKNTNTSRPQRGGGDTDQNKNNRDIVSFTVALGNCCEETQSKTFSACKFRMNNTKVDVLVKCKEKKSRCVRKQSCYRRTKDKNNTKHVPVETQYL